MRDAFFCYTNLFFTYLVFNYLINYIFQLGIIKFEKNMFLLLKFGKNMFLFLNLNLINSYKYSVFIKMKFVFQEIHKDPKHLQLWRIYRRFSHDCYIFSSAANKYYSSAGHHEQKNQKTTGQIKFSTVTIRQQIKLVLQRSLCK